MTRPTTQRCWLGPLQLHTFNYENTECIWCGPNQLAWKPGKWVSVGDGLSAWSVDMESPQESPKSGPKQIREAIKRDRGGDAPPQIQGYA